MKFSVNLQLDLTNFVHMLILCLSYIITTENQLYLYRTGSKLVIFFIYQVAFLPQMSKKLLEPNPMLVLTIRYDPFISPHCPRSPAPFTLA